MKTTFSLFAVCAIATALLLSGCKKETNPVSPPEDHFAAEGWILKDSTNAVSLAVFRGVVLTSFKGSPVKDTLFTIAAQTGSKYSVWFLDSLQATLAPPYDEPGHTLGFEIADASKIEAVKDSATAWSFRLKGKSPGKTQIKLQLLHEGHSDVTTPFIPVTVR